MLKSAVFIKLNYTVYKCDNFAWTLVIMLQYTLECMNVDDLSFVYFEG